MPRRGNCHLPKNSAQRSRSVPRVGARPLRPGRQRPAPPGSGNRERNETIPNSWREEGEEKPPAELRRSALAGRAAPSDPTRPDPIRAEPSRAEPPPARAPLTSAPGGRRPRQLAARLRRGAGRSSLAPAAEAAGSRGSWAGLGWAGRAEPCRAGRAAGGHGRSCAGLSAPRCRSSPSPAHAAAAAPCCRRARPTGPGF